MDKNRREETDLSESRILRNRFTSEEIFERVIVDADEEISRSYRELLFSGLAAGFAITLTVLLYASMTNPADGIPIVGALLYPIGFVYIILGNYQLYTENTLPPVALVIERMEGDSMRIPLKSLERQVCHGVPKVDL